MSGDIKNKEKKEVSRLTGDISSAVGEKDKQANSNKKKSNIVLLIATLSIMLNSMFFAGV